VARIAGCRHPKGVDGMGGEGFPFGYGLYLFHPRSQEVLVNIDSICPKQLLFSSSRLGRARQVWPFFSTWRLLIYMRGDPFTLRITSFPIPPILTLHYGTRFMYVDGMPGHAWDLDAENAFAGTDAEAGDLFKAAFVCGDFAIMDRAASIYIGQLLVKNFVKTTLDAHYGFGGFQVAVDWNLCPCLQGIQHSLAAIFGRSAQIEVRTQAHIFFGLLMKRQQQIFINQSYIIHTGLF